MTPIIPSPGWRAVAFWTAGHFDAALVFTGDAPTAGSAVAAVFPSPHCPPRLAVALARLACRRPSLIGRHPAVIDLRGAPLFAAAYAAERGA